ncbi:MAG: hypothetical protein RI101_09650 [Nitrospira sp.]|jgi:hypothetical protein|nr:hypothetical protein [Nitrospira sp.]
MSSTRGVDAPRAGATGVQAMNLVVHIPHRVTEEDSGALSLAQRAPTFIMESEGEERVCIATFPDLPKGIDLALQLIGESVRIHGAWASINARPISNLTKLWQRLECYRESLLVDDVRRHCLEKSALFHTLVGCEVSRCPVSCQFLCTPCRLMLQDDLDPSLSVSIADAATFAEVEWCPHLAAAMAPPAGAQPMLLNPRSARP